MSTSEFLVLVRFNNSSVIGRVVDEDLLASLGRVRDFLICRTLIAWNVDELNFERDVNSLSLSFTSYYLLHETLNLLVCHA